MTATETGTDTRPGGRPGAPYAGSRPRRAAPPFRLVRPAAADPAGAPVLDPEQQAVVAHRGGPLLVLAGPGTGKTTTLVEAVLARTRGRRALTADQILVLTFSRAAAAELRDRLGVRLGRGAAAGGAGVGAAPDAGAPGVPTVTTFHSFCFALVGQYQDPDLFSEPLRLLSGPEQDVVIRELVRGTAEPGGWDAGAPGAAADDPDPDPARRPGWPQALRAALGTRGFAEELRAVILRARELGLDPADLARHARQADRPDWSAAARFLGEYLDVADARGVLDYAELVHRAVLLSERSEVRAALRSRYRAVFVDEYQDTDPAQVRLLTALAGDGADLVAVGDPDQSIYAFRGADVTGILDFPAAFPRRDSSPADIKVLRTSRRAGPVLLAASRKVATRLPITRLPADRIREHRDLAAADPDGQGAGAVEAVTFPDARAELEAVADLLRRAHLEDDTPWAQMAVLVRSGDQLSAVRRALLAANVPVEVLGDDLPLAREPAVAALLAALRCAADPAALTPEAARALLTGPLGGLDSGDLRRLGRELRAEERAALPPGDPRPPRPAEHLIREAVAQPETLTAIDPQAARAAQTVARLLRAAGQCLLKGGAVEDALWLLWHGDETAVPAVRTGWPERLRRAVERGGAAGRLADRDLDAVIALFALAARAQERTGHAGVLDFISGLQAQAIAADILAERAHRGGAVQIMTAHRSKGLQWHLVVVAGVQDGLWPDLRRRGSLLDADRIGRGGLADPLSPAALLAEERRLFYVAVTRARRRLVVTAVDGEQEDGESPSRFLRELGVEVRPAVGARRRPLNLSALLAELRRTATDPAAPEQLRAAAVLRLARLAAASAPDGSRLAPRADPQRWWGLLDYTRNDEPIADSRVPVPLSASAVQEIDACGLKWFLERKAGAQEPTGEAQGVGQVFHALAEGVTKGEIAPDIEVLMDRLDVVWDRLPFDAPWKSEQERRAARRTLERFLFWHGARLDGRTAAAAEQAFEHTMTVGGVRVRLRGSIDRIEIDADGRVYLVDYKTSKQAKTKDKVATDPQLGVYQLVVQAGAAAPEVPPQAPIGQAELVYPRDEKDGPGPTVLVQPALEAAPDPQWAANLVADVAKRVLDERFHASGERAACEFCRLRKACPKQPEGRELPG
jgi:superfamily I DNA/RNA helicase/RecB family exonuclease